MSRRASIKTCRWLGAIFLGMVGPTAGRYLIDITSRQPAKQFVRGEWFVTAAALTAVVYLICAYVLGLSIWPATLISVVFGFSFRVTALWQGWEEPMPKMPPTSWKACPNGKGSSRSGRSDRRASSETRSTLEREEETTGKARPAIGPNLVPVREHNREDSKRCATSKVRTR